ncbi:MAG: EAL domain-containing protein [Pseudomonadota bacterium]
MGAHLVQFYEDDTFMIQGLSDYIGAALAAGDRGVVIATRDHLDRLEERLVKRGLLAKDRSESDPRYIPLEVDHMLPLFMEDGMPDQERFDCAIGEVIERATAGHAGHVHIFGEMVAILCASASHPLTSVGRHDAAIHVERYFNELIDRYSFSLLCAYPLHAFPREQDGPMFAEICDLHSAVQPTESYDPSASIDALHRTIALLQQQAQSLASEIHDRLKVEQALREVNYDRLTGLPNRTVFHDRLALDIKKAHRSHLPLALLFIDLDHFKEINDTMGHAIGDMLLRQVGQRLSRYVRESDTVTRLGGDEFTITLSELHDLNRITEVAHRILEDLTRPFYLDHHVAYISASIGITLFPQDANNGGDLLRNADQAMYQSKEQGRNRFTYFTRSMQEAAQLRMALSNDLRRAVDTSQLRLFYQPIVDMHSGRIVKAEALIRWQHPVLGEISPVDFIPIAEHNGLIVTIGDWVFHQALQEARRWRIEYPGFIVNVNVSPAQFYRSNCEHCCDWLKDYDRASLARSGGAGIGLEITEGLVMVADRSVLQQLSAFQEAGITISLDDFGTGYSSLSHLRKLNVDYLKIDQSFVFNLEHEPANVALCEAIIVMAHKLGLKVIAEGIETAEQNELLRRAGCDFGQGYLFGRPLPPNEFDHVLREAKRLARDDRMHI